MTRVRVLPSARLQVVSSREPCGLCGALVELTWADRENLHAVARSAKLRGFDWRRHRTEFLAGLCGQRHSRKEILEP